MKTFALIITLVVLSCPTGWAQGPSVSGEVDLDFRNRTASNGHSYPEIYSAGVRAGVTLNASLRGTVDAERRYNRNLIQEAALETDAAGGRLRGGLIRVPFGIYDTRETYASGLINYPIVRSGYDYNAVDWGAPGVVWIGGTPKLQLEAAAFDGVSSGDWNTRNYTGGAAARLQTYSGDLIIGVSRWDGYLSMDDHFSGREVVQMTGIDWRYTRPQLIVRGEYMKGIEGGDRMHGWYTDLYYRIPNYGKWTAVGRVEEFKPAVDENDGRQVTAGIRYVAGAGWNVSINWLCNNGRQFYHDSWMHHTRHGGDWYLQIYRTIGY